MLLSHIKIAAKDYFELRQRCVRRLTFNPMYNPDADFVEQIERNGDENQGHQVGRGDDGGHQHNRDEGVLAIIGKHR